jgi:hypothetical protein
MLDVNAKQWHRCGGGHRLSLFATPEEIQGWVLAFLPGNFAPYSILGEHRISEGRKFIRWSPVEMTTDSLAAELRSPPLIARNFWIRSHTLTPRRDVFTQGDFSANCSLNGLVLIQRHGIDSCGNRGGGSIGIVDRVSHAATGKIIKHSQYLSIFNLLKKRIRPSLLYDFEVEGPGGRSMYKSVMTQGVVDEINSGIAYGGQPLRA